MAFDYKKEQKELYRPKTKPVIVKVPEMNYISIRGKGDPNEEDGEYSKAIQVLYAISYAIKMSYKKGYSIKGFFEYVVPPLEGFWWQEGVEGVDYTDKSTFNWISAIRLPEFVRKEHVEWAKEFAQNTKKLEVSKAEFIKVNEGLCVQIMHIGPFDEEPETIEVMNKFVEESGFETDINDNRLHHEIYLSNIKKVDPSKWKTVIRHPIRKKRR